MALPILAKGITSALVKKGKSAKKDDKVSAQKLLPSSTTSSTKSRAQFSKVEPRKLAPYRKKVETTKFLPPSKVDEKFSISKFDALLTSLVGSTANLQRITKKDLSDERKNNRTKENIKQKSKRQRNEEKTESKKTVAKVSKPMKLTMPSLFMDIFKIGGRLILSLGIMELLKFLDPEKKESIFGFLMEHLDKITIGFLGIMGALFISSFLPVISVVISLLSILVPVIKVMAGFIIKSLASMLLNPLVWKAVIIGILGKAIYDDIVNRGTDKNDGISGENAPWRKEDLTSRERVIIVATIYGRDRSNWPDDVVKDLEELNKKSDARDKDKKKSFIFGGGNVYTDPSQYQDPGDLTDILPNIPDKVVEKDFTPEIDAYSLRTPQHQGPVMGTPPPQAQPQTPMMGDTRLGSASGDSGSAMYKGRGKKAALSVGITPFLQSDIDKQGISIISGFGKRFGRDHKGYDLPAAEGTPLHAYLPGVVVRNMPNVSGYGNLVEWKDDVYGQTHMFAHMMEPSELRSGTKFKAGTVLGKVGNTDGGTGISEGPHLHWEIGPQGSEVDPGEWLKSHPINMAPKKPPNKAQEVSSTASYEETGLQVAMIQVPLPVPVPSSGGGGGTSSGGSRGSGGYDIDSIILGQSFSNA